ncbi:MAG: YceI family protein [Saprospiraceae bacterium]|nr:YceI family protein [Bacteroidia bacterium]NNE14069.1 YceI family protein [Saprospiraceae bacterium]NNL91305.1 YceI family protein [Saprospiraceae bacterium]
MRTLLLSALCFVATLSMASTEPVHGGKVDVEASTVNWVGKKVTGQHTGTIKIQSGELMMKDGMLKGGSFVIDMTTITCTDLPEKPGNKLVGHLSSDDFFGIENHKTATLTITEASKRGDSNNYEVMADLTIKGITKPIEFIAQVSDHEAKADISIDRTQYDIKYGSGSFFDGLGDKMIYDNFELSIDLVLTH